GRAIAWAGLNRATAALRLGRIDAAEAAIARAETAMTAEQRSGGLVPASLHMLRSQAQRARGDLAGAGASALLGAGLAFEARDGSALARGTVIASGATAMLLLGELDAALRLSGQADTLWREAGVGTNGLAHPNAPPRRNALPLGG